MAVFPILVSTLSALSVISLGYVVVVSIQHRRYSSILQIGRLVLIAGLIAGVGFMTRPIDAGWAAGLVGVIGGGVIAWWYGRHTIRQASLGVNVSLIVLIAGLMTVSIVRPEWLDPRSFLIAGSLLGIRLLIAANPQTRLQVPSRRKGDRVMRIATIWMLLFAAAAAFVIATGFALSDAAEGAGTLRNVSLPYRMMTRWTS